MISLQLPHHTMQVPNVRLYSDNARSRAEGGATYNKKCSFGSLLEVGGDRDVMGR